MPELDYRYRLVVFEDFDLSYFASHCFDRVANVDPSCFLIIHLSAGSIHSIDAVDTSKMLFCCNEEVPAVKNW
jgi:hypothetical protein